MTTGFRSEQLEGMVLSRWEDGSKSRCGGRGRVRLEMLVGGWTHKPGAPGPGLRWRESVSVGLWKTTELEASAGGVARGEGQG